MPIDDGDSFCVMKSVTHQVEIDEIKTRSAGMCSVVSLTTARAGAMLSAAPSRTDGSPRVWQFRSCGSIARPPLYRSRRFAQVSDNRGKQNQRTRTASAV